MAASESRHARGKRCRPPDDSSRRLFWLDTAAVVVGGGMLVGYQAQQLDGVIDAPRALLYAGYVFGDLHAETDAAALVEGARLFARSSDGLMPWRDRPPPLKRGLIARVPPIDHEDA